MQINAKQFSWLVTFLEDAGAKVIKVPVKWNHNTLSQNTDEFIDFFNGNKTGNDYVLGFSYGAIITFLSANVIKPRKIFLCSLSPDFVEDRSEMDKSEIKYIGKKRFADTANRSAVELAQSLQAPSVVFYGEKEGERFPALKKRCEETAVLAKNSKLVVVKDAPHQIDFPSYVDAIKNELLLIIGKNV